MTRKGAVAVRSLNSQERLAKLVNGIAVVRVGGSTEVERRERHHSIEGRNPRRPRRSRGGSGPRRRRRSAACRRARGSPGLGRGAAARLGIVRRACEQPLRQLVINAGGDTDTVVARGPEIEAPGLWLQRRERRTDGPDRRRHRRPVPGRHTLHVEARSSLDAREKSLGATSRLPSARRALRDRGLRHGDRARAPARTR